VALMLYLIFFAVLITSRWDVAVSVSFQVKASMFSVTTSQTGGSAGCLQKQYSTVTNPPPKFDPTTDWFTHKDDDSITIQASPQTCRTINTEGKCYFSFAEGQVNKITFDFEVNEACISPPPGCWLAFWTFSKNKATNPSVSNCNQNPGWCSTREVDFIETNPGPTLNTNFDGNGQQVEINNADKDHKPWKGSITANFEPISDKDKGDSVHVTVSNSLNDNVGEATLDTTGGYFFIMDTTPFFAECSITVKNIVLHGVDGCAPATGKEDL